MTKSGQGQLEVFQLQRPGEVEGVKLRVLLTFLWLKTECRIIFMFEDGS